MGLGCVIVVAAKAGTMAFLKMQRIIEKLRDEGKVRLGDTGHYRLTKRA